MTTSAQIIADMKRIMEAFPNPEPMVRVLPSAIMTEPELRTEIIDRSMKERLLSWPWIPLIKTKEVTYTVQVPSKKMYEIDGRAVGAGNVRLIVCHPVMAEKILLAMQHD